MKYRELLEKIQNALRDEKPSESQHSYAQATALRVPRKLPLAIQGQATSSKRTLRKTNILTKDWNKEVQNTSDCSSHMESDTVPGSHLIPARVHRWTIKNYASIIRKMQLLVKSQETEMSGKISVISTTEATAKKDQNDLLFDMMKRREERQFRIEKPLC